MLTRALFIVVLSATPAWALELSQPIDCTPGKDCFIQQYVDRDEGPGVQDYACGAETYDGHKGTDIRLRTTADVEKGVAVKASAEGTVVGLRDGVADHLVRSAEDRAAIKDRECGNGVMLDHGDGWKTQYCHMRKGSVAVNKGDHVASGAKLGEVGYSGDAGFAHVHLQVTKDDKVVDPFLAEDKTACRKDGPSLWSKEAKAALSYQEGVVLGLGFADHGLDIVELETGAAMKLPSAQTPMVAYVWAINLQKGDIVQIALIKDRAVVQNNSDTLDRSKAQFMLFAGKKAPPTGWPKGSYKAAAKVSRGGKTVIEENKIFELN
jgi:murein DD-endopeptidase MepM/ murein hydrolase activator NlpD